MTDSIEQTYGAEKPSYYVYREGGRSPTKKHPNRFSAMKEAQRLAKKDAGATYHVLKVRATFVNTDPLPQGEIDNFTKQMRAREGMAPGSIVVVNKDHYRFAGEIGYIDRLGDGDDTSVYVNFAGDIQRFSPSSLTLRSKPHLAATSEGIRRAFDGMYRPPEEPAPLADATTDDTPPMGLGSVLGLLAAIVASSSIRARQRAAESSVEEAEDNTPEAKAAYSAARAIPIGTDVFIMGDSVPFIGAMPAYAGRLARYDEEAKFVWVTMTNTDTGKTEEIKVNGSRVKRMDDPALLVI